MRAPRLIVFPLAAAALIASGCGTTEKSGAVGDTLTAKGIDVTVIAVDDSVPVPKSDVTGLSQPAPGQKLVGVRVKVCSEHGGAIGPYDFSIETTSGDPGRLKFPETNYPNSFDSFRAACGDGWVVFEIPAGSDPGKVKFNFQDTGTAQHPETEVDARFSWDVS
jgi:hypothetical protein